MTGVVLYDVNNHEVFISRNVTHYENKFPYLGEHHSSWDYHIHTESKLSPNNPKPNAHIDSTLSHNYSNLNDLNENDTVPDPSPQDILNSYDILPQELAHSQLMTNPIHTHPTET